MDASSIRSTDEAHAGLSVGQDTAKVAGLIVVGAVVFLAALRVAFRSNLGG